MKKWLCGLVVFLAVVPYCPVTAGNATLSSNVFKNIVVAFSSAIDDELDTAAINGYINTIQNLTAATSNTLFRATGNRLSFGTITILGPSNWVNWNSAAKSRAVRSAPSYNPPSFDTADIRIDVPNAAYGFMPYTQQSRFCGERGDFIHLTTDFIKGAYDISTLGTPDILLAREWVKYYFGVFDEQGYDYSNMYPVKYFAPGGTLVNNVCSDPSDIHWEDNSCSGQSSIQGVPSTCNFEVDTSYIVNTSMMSLPLAPVAFSFCSNDSEHNADAPNKHNVMCDGLSVMEVVLKNSEVHNPTVDVTPPSPTFSLEQFTTSTNGLVLSVLWDNFVSPDRQVYSAYASFTKFIWYDFPIGGTFALQQTAKQISPTWCSITADDNSRKNCLANSPRPISGPNIGIKDLRSSFNSITTSTNFNDNIKAVLFISDSAINTNDSSFMCTNAKDRNFQLFVASYNSNAVNIFQTNPDCAGFVQATYIRSPKSPYDNTVWDSDVQSCYGFLQERKLIDEFLRALPNVAAPMLYGPPQIYYEELLLNSTQQSLPVLQYSTSVTNMTNRFYYESCDNLGSSGQVRDFLSCNVTGSDAMCAPGEADTNIYCGDPLKYTGESTVAFECECSPIYRTNLYQQPPYLAYIVGQPLNALVDGSVAPSITLKSWVVVSKATLGSPGTDFNTVRIFASLNLGSTPIFNAYVTATVVFGTNSSVLIQLRDDGSGNPDVTYQDGVYSSYFTQYGQFSTFTVSVSANDNGLMATYPTKPYAWISKSYSMENKQLESFTRVASGGSFSVDSLTNGNLPPGRIMDLQLESTSSDSVTLRWTTPGADLDYGKADNYHIKCTSSANKDDLSPSNFDSTSSTASSNPANPGGKQTYTVSGLSVDGQTHYCAVLTCDSFKACSLPSNIVPYSIQEGGLTSGQIAGISIGVIIAIIIIVLISVLIFFKCFRKKDKTVSTGNLHNSQTLTGEDKLKPIEVEALPNTAIYQPGYGLENEGAQKHSRPTSARSINDSFDSITSKNTQNIGHNAMLSFGNNSRTPSPRPVAIPKIPTPPIIHPIDVIEMDSPPSREVIINARPLQAIYERDRPASNDSVFFVNNPDVARPVLLTQMATIEDTGDYQDVNFKSDIPVYHHLLNKPTMYTASPGVPPPAPPKKNNYGNVSMESQSSSSSSSSSAHTNRSPRHNTQV